MDPVTGSMILGGLGGLFGGIGQSRSASKDRAESKRQFDLGYGLQKGEIDTRNTRQAALGPDRRAMLAALMQRLGIPTGIASVSGGAAPGAMSAPAAPPAHQGVLAGGPTGAGSAERAAELARALGVRL